jgi:hypothetical protein
VAALDVLLRKVGNRDQRPVSDTCAPSMMVDKRWDAGREIRLAAGTRREDELGSLNSDIVCGSS